MRYSTGLEEYRKVAKVKPQEAGTVIYQVRFAEGDSVYHTNADQALTMMEQYEGASLWQGRRGEPLWRIA